jgi:hypothetical protein
MDNTTVKVAFSTAATDLALICAATEQCESWEVLTNELTEQFTTALTNTVAAVDRRKALLRENEARIQAVTRHRDDANAYLKKLEKIRESVIATTKQVVEAHPNMTFHDSFGIPLTVRQNPPKVIIDESAFEITNDSRYVHTKTTVHIDLAEVKKDLLAGKDVAGARLEYGSQLRGLK